MPGAPRACCTAFPHAVDYDSFWIKHKASAFTAAPLALIDRLRAMPPEEIRRRQQAMERYRTDILYDAPPWRMGDHLLRSAAICARRRLGDPRISRCRSAAEQRAKLSLTRAPRSGTAAGGVAGRAANDDGGATNASHVDDTSGGRSVDGACDCATRSRSAACDYGRRCALAASATGGSSGSTARARRKTDEAQLPTAPSGDTKRATQFSLRERIQNLEAELAAARTQLDRFG